MSITTLPVTYVDGQVLTASDLNSNFVALNTATVPVGSGGTGLTGGTSGGVLYFSSTSAIGSSGVLTQYGLIYGGGAGAAPVALGAATNGQIPIGSTGAAPVLAAITAGAGVTVTNAAGAITIASDVDLVASSDTEGTTTSTSLADLKTFSSLSIAGTKTIRIVGNWRKTTGAAASVRLGLKLNTTEMYTAPSTITSAANSAESGPFEFVIPPRTDANYSHGVRKTTVSVTTAAVNEVPDGTVPTATITDIIIRGTTDNALVTFGVSNIRIYVE